MEDCFFFIDESVPPEERKMSVICVDCQEKHKLNAWFYDGSRSGYGPYDFKCCKCGKLVHSKEEYQEHEED